MTGQLIQTVWGAPGIGRCFLYVKHPIEDLCDRRRRTLGDGTGFPTAGHLASYAGLAPATKSSGTSIRGEHAPHRGNRLLKRALFQAAFAVIGCKADPSSRTYYDRQRARGKTHTQAILRLARQRVNVIHAMIRTGALYEPRTPSDVDLAA